MKKLAFTLAEIMIVLMVIGILTAILLPSARQAMPNENVMKFKKAHNALYTAFHELVTSDKYCLDGDLGVKADGTELDSSTADEKYLCQIFADVMNAKEVNCLKDGSTDSKVAMQILAYCDGTDTGTIYSTCRGAETTEAAILSKRRKLDESCLESYKNDPSTYKQIIMADGITYWDKRPNHTFGYKMTNGLRLFSSPHEAPVIANSDGFDIVYKIFCMDIDGIPDGATKNNCINECPFGYGIRADGKILNGIRAQEWLEKSIQEKD